MTWQPPPPPPPQMLVLYKDPEGNTVFTSTAASVNTSAAKGGAGGENMAELSTLRKRVMELENKLAKYKVQWFSTILQK